MITAARATVEKVQWRQLITATWDIHMEAFPYGVFPIVLPFPPLQTITHVKYYDTSNAIQTFSSAYYTVLAPTRGPGLVQLVVDNEWPETVVGRADAVEVRMVCGYGVASAVPETTKTAIKMLAAEYYLSRSATAGSMAGSTGAPEWSNAVEALIQLETCRVRSSSDLG